MIKLMEGNVAPEVIQVIRTHAEPTPRDFDMRLGRLFEQAFGIDYKDIMEDDFLWVRFPRETNSREWVWRNVIEWTLGLWSNHTAWQREIALERVREERLHQCQVCGNLYCAEAPRTRQTIWGEREICDECNRQSWKCSVCNEYHYGIGNRYSISGTWLCRPCFMNGRDDGSIVHCRICTGDVFIDDTYMDNDGSRICFMCQEERLIHCVECGREIWDGRDRMRWIEDDAFCMECYNDFAVVAQYDHYIPDPPMLTLPGEKQRDDTLFFGLEFEIEDDWSNQEIPEFALGKRALESVPKDWGYCKHDGSMHRGVEYVTHPMTPLFYKANRKEYDEMLNRWKADGFRTDQWDDENQRYNCGLHMHMSKDAFTSGHLYKFVRFFYKVPMRRLIQQISQRDANYYARWAYEDYEHGVKVAKEKKNISGQRYSVINLIGGHWHEQHNDRPAKTVEFRLFQGTLEPAILHKNIEFMLAVFFFTRDTSITHITEKNFMRFLAMTPNKWRYLTTFLRDKLGKEI